MPKGSPVSGESWRARHRIVRLALWLCVPTLVVVGLLGPMPLAETLLLPAVIALFAAVPEIVHTRDLKADITGIGLILASFAGVELSGGQIHAHLFILSAVALVALYQRWGPLLFAIAAVAGHHFVFGLVAPGRVFNMSMGGMTMDAAHASTAELVAMVVAHVTAIAIEVFAILVFWRFSEELSDKLQNSLDELRVREEQVRHQATHDPLTGLPNRARFGDEVMNQLRSGHPFAVLMLDLDDFKPVNDTYGHHAGDQLLTLVAERLVRCLGGRDLPARLGGDEFAVLVREKTDQHSVQHVADKIIASVSEPFQLEDARVSVSVGLSIGIARTEETVSLDDLMRRADSAMYTAKRAGKGQWVLHGGPEGRQGDVDQTSFEDARGPG